MMQDPQAQEFWFVRAASDGKVNRPFLWPVVFTSTEEAEAAIRLQREDSYGYQLDVINWVDVTPEELQNTLNMLRFSGNSPTQTVFLAFWKGRDSRSRLDPLLCAVYAVWDHSLNPDAAISEIRRMYGVPLPLHAVPLSAVLN